MLYHNIIMPEITQQQKSVLSLFFKSSFRADGPKNLHGMQQLIK